MKNNTKADAKQTSSKGKNTFLSLRPWLIILACVFLVFGITFIVYFFENYHHVKKFSFDNATGELYDKSTGITYIEAPMYFEPVRVASSAYATDGYREYFQIGYVEEENGEKTEHLIPTTTLLVTAKDQGSFIYYNPNEISIPEFKDFSTDLAYICDLDYNTLDELDSNASEILADAYLNGERVALEGCDAIFEVRFRSSKYKWASFCIDLYLIGDKFYFHDMLKKETILLPSVAQKLIDTEKLSLFTEEKN